MKTNNAIETQHNYPWWLIYTFDNPIRKLIHNPQVILASFIKPGMTVLDVGCGIGCFSIDMAKLVGPQGKVIGADLQQQMLNGLSQRAKKAGLQERIYPHLCSADKIGVSEALDFTLAFWMVHEVDQPLLFLTEIFTLLKPGGMFLMAEPIIHVSRESFESEVLKALSLGFEIKERPSIKISYSVMLSKPI